MKTDDEMADMVLAINSMFKAGGFTNIEVIAIIDIVRHTAIKRIEQR